jgi:hypothetical protein
MRRIALVAFTIGAVSALVAGCATSDHPRSDNGKHLAGVSSLEMAPPCPPPSFNVVVGSQVISYSQLPITIHGPFTNIGVTFGPQSPGMQLISARLDVVDRRRLPAALTATDRPDPAAAAAAQDQLIEGTEPGLTARSQLSRFAEGPFVVPLANVNAALHVSGAAPAYSGQPPASYATPFASVPPAQPAPAGGFEVYLISQFAESSCAPDESAPSTTTSAHGTVDLATLLP